MKAVLFTVTTLIIFLAVLTLSSFVIQQKNDNVYFTNKLTSSNNVFYHFDSIEYGTRKIEQTYGPNITVRYVQNLTNLTIKEKLPAKYAEDILKFQKFVKQMALTNAPIDITTSIGDTKYLVSPYNLTIENTVDGISNTFLNRADSLGKLKSMRLDIYANDTTSPIKSDDATDPDGINLFIFLHTTHGQIRTYNQTLDPNRQTNISVHIAYGPPEPPRQSHNAEITFGPNGQLNVTLELGLEFYYVQSLLLEDYGKVNINSFSNIIVNNTVYGTFKNSSVSVIPYEEKG